MRNFTFINLFLLAVAILASFCTANVADAAPPSKTFTVINKDNKYSAYVAIFTVERSGNRVHDVVMGWWEIKPHSSHVFNKGNDLRQFYVYIKMNNVSQRIPNFEKRPFFIHPDRFRTESTWRNYGSSVAYIVDDEAYPEQIHKWGGSYQHNFVRPSSSFLKENGWKSVFFYEIPEECQSLTLNQH